MEINLAVSNLISRALVWLTAWSLCETAGFKNLSRFAFTLLLLFRHCNNYQRRKEGSSLVAEYFFLIAT